MATVKKAKNLSAGPSKMTKKAGPVDAKGKWTKVQERTLGNMKKGGTIKKAQNGLPPEMEKNNPFVIRNRARQARIDSMKNSTMSKMPTSPMKKPMVKPMKMGGKTKKK
jgi:hypothetical protein